MKKLMNIREMRNSSQKGNNSSVTKGQVKQMLNSRFEKVENFVDTITTVSAQTSTPTFTDLTALTVGTGQNNRNGIEITLRKMTCNWSATVNVTDVHNIVRFVVFKWHPSNSTDTPTAAKLFFDGGSATPSNCPFVGTKPSRFKVIYDKVVDLDAAHVVVSGSSKLQGVKGEEIGFDFGVNSGTDHLYLCTVSDSSLGNLMNFASQIVFDQ
jgi:hypothetical protein